VPFDGKACGNPAVRQPLNGRTGTQRMLATTAGLRLRSTLSIGSVPVTRHLAALQYAFGDVSGDELQL